MSAILPRCPTSSPNASIASPPSGRTASPTSSGCNSCCADLIPAWGIAAGRHVIVAGADRRILARVPIEASLGQTDGILDTISSAQLLGAPSLQGKVTDIVLPNGNRALVTTMLIKALPGRVIVLQENVEPVWGSEFRALGDAVGHHGLRRADPRLRLSLAIHPRP